jgi:hypothetical protein
MTDGLDVNRIDALQIAAFYWWTLLTVAVEAQQ